MIAEISARTGRVEGLARDRDRSVESESAAAQLGLDPSVRGVLVTEVYEGGPGGSAGVVEGDVIVAAGGRPIGSRPRLTEILSRLDPATSSSSS